MLPSRVYTYSLVEEGRVPLAIHRNLVRDAEAIPVDLWSHVKDIRGMLSRAKVRVALKAHWCLLSVRVDASVVTTPSLPSPLCYHAGVVRESSTAVPPGIHTTSRSTRGPIDP